MTPKHVVPLVAGLVAGLLALPAPAEAKKPRAKPTAAAKAPANDQDADTAACTTNDEGTTTCSFDNDVVGGAVLKPEGQNLTARGKKAWGSLIRVRGHFLPELIRMAQDV
jgi:hypothetical protein